MGAGRTGESESPDATGHGRVERMEDAEKKAAKAAARKAKDLLKKQQAEEDAKLPPRQRVHKAQLRVLDKIDKILTGNCSSATKGNWNCAKFVLDWSLISDLRTPLAKPLKQKTFESTLMQRLKKLAKQKQRQDEQAAASK